MVKPLETTVAWSSGTRCAAQMAPLWSAPVITWNTHTLVVVVGVVVVVLPMQLPQLVVLHISCLVHDLANRFFFVNDESKNILSELILFFSFILRRRSILPFSFPAPLACRLSAVSTTALCFVVSWFLVATPISVSIVLRCILTEQRDLLTERDDSIKSTKGVKKRK
jgi:hypothetical protein